MPNKPLPNLVWDHKEEAPANPASPWKKYESAYIPILETWTKYLRRKTDRGQKLVFNAVILKGRANPQLAVYLLLFGYLKDNAQVFLCCTRPYLRNLHYNAVDSFFLHVALYWETKMGVTHLRIKKNESISSVHIQSAPQEVFKKWLSANNFV